MHYSYPFPYLPLLLAAALLLPAPGRAAPGKVQASSHPIEKPEPRSPVEPPPKGALSRQRPVLAILPFNDANARARENGYGSSLSAMLITEMRNHSNFTVLERSKVAEAFPDKELSPLGVTRSQIRQLQQLFQAEVVLTGDIAAFGSLLEVDTRLISTRTQEVVAAAHGRAPAEENLRGLMRTLAQDLEKKYLRQWMGAVTVASQPLAAEVYLNGDLVGKTDSKSPLRIADLLEGRYRLELVAPGYKTWAESVEVAPKSLITVNASLTALPGNLIITSQPVEAKVFLDGKESGRTPLELKGIAEGEHRLRLELENHYPWEEKVFVNSGQSTQTNASLALKLAVLEVASVPAGADVHVNGRFFGKTPLRIDKVAPGKVSVEVAAEDYRTFAETFNVKPDDTLKLVQNLELQTGFLTVVSVPRDVKVTLVEDGRKREVGKAPVVREKLNVGGYEVLLEKPGYFPESREIVIENDRELRLETLLRQKPGFLRVRTAPGTEVLVDGAFRGQTPLQDQELAEGRYDLRLNSFYGTDSSRVEVFSDRTSTVETRFRKSRTYLLGSLLFIVSLGGFIAL